MLYIKQKAYCINNNLARGKRQLDKKIWTKNAFGQKNFELVSVLVNRGNVLRIQNFGAKQMAKISKLKLEKNAQTWRRAKNTKNICRQKFRRINFVFYIRLVEFI